MVALEHTESLTGSLLGGLHERGMKHFGRHVEGRGRQKVRKAFGAIDGQARDEGYGVPLCA